MVAPAAPASLHLLTPGTPAYALLKLGAVGSVFALRYALVRRQRAKAEVESPPAPQPVSSRRDPHPVKKKRRRRRRRR